MALRFLIDSDACIAFLEGADVALRGRWLRTPADDITLCSVVRAELIAGAWGSRDPAGNAARVERLFDAFVSLPFDDRAANACGEIVGALKRRGRVIGLADAMIASIAVSNDLTLVTRNVRHFTQVEGLRVVRWSGR